MRKIAILANSIGCGGTERVISRLIPGLCEKYEVYVFVLDGSRTEFVTENAAHMISLGYDEKKNRLAYFMQIISKSRKFRKLIKEYDIQCVISFLSVPNLINILFNKSAKTIISIRGQLRIKGKWTAKLKYRLEKHFYKKADGVLVPSMYLRQDLINSFRVGEEKIAVVYNPFEAEDILSSASKDLPEEYIQLYKNNRILVSLGRLTYEKGYRHLLHVFKLVSERYEDVRLVIIGDGKIKTSLNELTNELGINEKVIFTGKITEPFPFLKNAYMYTMSSVSEGFPNALVESMICGLPVVSTDCRSGPREILYNSPDINEKCVNTEYADYGIMVPVFDEDGDNSKRYEIMAKAVLEVLGNDSLRNEYADKGQLRAKQFTTESCINGYQAFIEKICEDR